MVNWKTEEKEKLLEMFGWEKLIGFMFPNPTDQNYEQHFVSTEDVFKALKKGEQWYYWYEGRESMSNIDDAFEELIEEFWDIDYPDEEQESVVLAHLVKKLQDTNKA